MPTSATGTSNSRPASGRVRLRTAGRVGIRAYGLTRGRSSGFTLLDDVRCKKAIPLPDPKLLAGALADLQLCPPLER